MRAPKGRAMARAGHGGLAAFLHATAGAWGALPPRVCVNCTARAHRHRRDHAHAVGGRRPGHALRRGTIGASVRRRPMPVHTPQP